MALSQIDRDALNLARQHGIEFLVVDSGNIEHDVLRAQIGVQATIPEMSVILSDAMDAAMRIHGDAATIWIDITSQSIPEFVEKAISRKSDFSQRLMVTHFDCCSHAPGAPLAKDLQEAIYRARCPGVIWHPLAKSVVNAEPQQYFVKA